MSPPKLQSPSQSRCVKMAEPLSLGLGIKQRGQDFVVPFWCLTHSWLCPSRQEWLRKEAEEQEVSSQGLDQAVHPWEKAPR